MLEYENQMFLDILHQDGLVIAAKGLGLESVFLSLLKVYSDPGNLVVVLGTTGKEEEFYLSQLEAEGVKCLPKVITNEYNSAEREIVYLEGGVLFMSSRILVVDLLKDRVPVANITGFLVCRAHSILESCQEAFALRLYRQKNKTGFVKAFSNSAQAFTVGFAQVERIMKTLFVKNLYLWPRFHATVHSSLEKLKPSVVELHLEMTPAMLQIQTALLDLMNFTVKEMRRVNPSLDMDDLTVENAISKSFHKVLQLQLDPIWHQLSSKTKQLVADLRTLSHILVSLSRYDCVTFNTQLSSLRNMDYVIKNSGWMLLDAAETLFLVAKQRVLGRPREKTDSDKEKNKKDPDKEKGIELLDVDPEPSPKWMALTEVLKEINETSKVKLEGSTGGTDKLLILVEDNRICEQIKQYLTLGAKAMLLRLYERAFNCRVRPAPVPVPQEKVGGEEEEEEDGEMKESYTLSQRPASDDANDIKLEVVDMMEPEKEESSSIDAQPPMIVIHTFKKYGDPLALSRTLREVRPRFVLMYDADMAAVRRLEVYQSEHSEFQFQVFFLMYGGSVEEQAYLTSLRREKEAFDYLIKQKASMVVPEDQDGLSEDCTELSRDASKPNMAAGPNTRKGGHPTRLQTTTVIVDMREFRSELPALIHKRGIEIEPVTLQVGDYILTPEICVERKSVSDLIGSLNSGRLYNQALAMTRYYAKPMLLIEFDQNKPFALQAPQEEVSHVILDDGSVEKTVRVRLLCKVEWFEGQLTASLPVRGLAVVVKPKSGDGKARVMRVMNVTVGGNMRGFTLTPGVSDHCRRITVSGQLIGDVPIQYTVIGLNVYEIPVIGTYVDPRIVPGFDYRVRPAGSKHHLFQGRALTLTSVGPGYGKRLTFAPDLKCLNSPNNYLWSDSHPEGLGFEPRALHVGMRLAIVSESEELGEAVVFRTDYAQQEEKQEVVSGMEGTTVTKYIYVDVTCHVTLKSQEDIVEAMRVSGTAVVVREPGQSKARLRRIENVGLASQLNLLFVNQQTVVVFYPL